MSNKEKENASDHSVLSTTDSLNAPDAPVKPSGAESEPTEAERDTPKEYGGRKGPDPTRYGDWEKNGRCIDF